MPPPHTVDMECVTSTSTPADEQPLLIEPPNLDFGSVRQESTLEATFILTNRKKTPLLLTRVIPDCGCTVVDFEKGPLGPGESRKILARLRMGKHQGVFSKSLSIAFDDLSQQPVSQVMTCSLRGNIVLKYDLSPGSLAFQRTRADSFEISIMIRDRPEAVEVDLESKDDFLVVRRKITSPLDGSDCAKFVVEFRPELCHESVHNSLLFFGERAQGGLTMYQRIPVVIR